MKFRIDTSTAKVPEALAKYIKAHELHAGASITTGDDGIIRPRGHGVELFETSHELLIFNMDTGHAYLQGLCIMKKGEWADIVEKVEEATGYLVTMWLSEDEYVEDELGSFISGVKIMELPGAMSVWFQGAIGDWSFGNFPDLWAMLDNLNIDADELKSDELIKWLGIS